MDDPGVSVSEDTATLSDSSTSSWNSTDLSETESTAFKLYSRRLVPNLHSELLSEVRRLSETLSDHVAMTDIPRERETSPHQREELEAAVMSELRELLGDEHFVALVDYVERRSAEAENPDDDEPQKKRRRVDDASTEEHRMDPALKNAVVHLHRAIRYAGKVLPDDELPDPPHSKKDSADVASEKHAFPLTLLRALRCSRRPLVEMQEELCGVDCALIEQAHRVRRLVSAAAEETRRFNHLAMERILLRSLKERLCTAEENKLKATANFLRDVLEDRF